MSCLWVFGGSETCGGNGSCRGGYLLCLWVKIECLHGGLAVEIIVGSWWRLEIGGGFDGLWLLMVVVIGFDCWWRERNGEEKSVK